MNRVLISFGIMLMASAASAQDAGRGAELFADHCAVCHGTSGVGDGPMAEVLTQQPPDLTALSGDGAFPTAWVVARIDGRNQVLAHGGPMPLFGMILQGEGGVLESETGNEIITSAAIADLVAYLKTVQR